MTTVEIRNIRKTFGDFVALEGLDLRMNDGEFVSFLGPSGCGKTTALRIVAGFEMADSGTVLVNERDISNQPPNRRDMGMVFQSYSLFPNMTARENVSFGLRVRKQSASSTKDVTQRMLDLVGLAGKEENYPHQMSGGQQQRVALARALAIEPQVLLLDEPLSALDAKVRVSLRNEIRVIQRELGISTIFVTHDQEEALTISDRIAVLSQGKLEQFGTPEEIYRHPATPFVAAFVGESNVFHGTIVADSADPAVRIAGETLPVDDARGWANGDRVRVLTRPESTYVSADGTHGVAATVVSQQFQGARTRILAHLDHVEDANAVILCDVSGAGHNHLVGGTKVRVTFDARTALVARADDLVAAETME
jgi:putative spermidine/putrescine transport system ATP-binding protein